MTQSKYISYKLKIPARQLRLTMQTRQPLWPRTGADSPRRPFCKIDTKEDPTTKHADDDDGDDDGGGEYALYVLCTFLYEGGFIVLLMSFTA